MADAKTHLLKVTKGGFETFTKEFTVKGLKGEPIRVRLEPAPQVAGKDTWYGWPADAPKPAIAPFNAEQAKEHQEAWAKYLNVPMEYKNSIGMKFALIPPGEFMMGSTPAEIEEALKIAGEDKNWQACFKSEAPKHKVILTHPIYLGIHEVTQAEYEKVMNKNPSYFSKDGPEKQWVEKVAGLDTSVHPVEGVSWNDAAEFCAKLSEQEMLKPNYFLSGETMTMLKDGSGYRLPTEAEWEYACSAGTTTRYWIGDKDEDLPLAGWFGGSRTHKVGELKANPLGLYDIHGNVWEWVQDWWEPTFYRQFQVQPALNPNGTSSGTQRVLRGGNWYFYASFCRTSNRLAGPPTNSANLLGFRASLTVDAVRQALKVTGPELPRTTSDKVDLIAKPTTPDSADIRAAKWAISVGGKTTWESDTDFKSATSLAELPTANAYRLASVFLGDRAKLPDGLSAEAIRVLTETKHLKYLQPSFVPMTDGQFKELAQRGNWSNIFQLDIRSERLTSAGLSNLSAFPVLKELFIAGSGMDDGIYTHLELIPNLNTLSIESSNISGEGLARLKKLPQLKKLYLRGNTRIEVKHLGALSGLNLESLGIDSQVITDESLGEFARSPSLRELNLTKTAVSDAGLPHLAKMSSLQVLHLKATKCSRAGIDKTVKLWDVPTGKERAILKGHTAPVTSVAYSPDGQTLASGSSDETISLWDARTGKLRLTLRGHTRFIGAVWSVAFSADGKTVASGSYDTTIKLWDVETGMEQVTFLGHTNPVYSVALSPNGKSLASGSHDKTVKLWDVSTGKERVTLKGHTDVVRSVMYSPDGKTLATLGNGQIKLWNLADDEPADK